jgi:acetyl esterase/lipase
LALKPDPEITARNVAPVATPILIIVGTDDRLLPMDTALHDALAAANKSVRMEIYERGYHDFVLGPQGQSRPDQITGRRSADPLVDGRLWSSLRP